jgi:hypothetical protein
MKKSSPPDVPHEPLVEARPGFQQFGEQLDHPIALPESIGVIIHLEIVKIKIDDDVSFAVVLKRVGNVFVNEFVACQVREGILIDGSGDLFFIDDAMTLQWKSSKRTTASTAWKMTSTN